MRSKGRKRAVQGELHQSTHRDSGHRFLGGCLLLGDETKAKLRQHLCGSCPAAPGWEAATALPGRRKANWCLTEGFPQTQTNGNSSVVSLGAPVLDLEAAFCALSRQWVLMGPFPKLSTVLAAGLGLAVGTGALVTLCAASEEQGRV